VPPEELFGDELSHKVEMQRIAKTFVFLDGVLNDKKAQSSS
jgi:hypothetical protein